MAQFGGMSTGTILGKGLEEYYNNNPDYLSDIEKIKEFIESKTGFKITKIQASTKQATIYLRGFTDV